jgi:hypothetical protein
MGCAELVCCRSRAHRVGGIDAVLLDAPAEPTGTVSSRTDEERAWLALGAAGGGRRDVGRDLRAAIASSVQRVGVQRAFEASVRLGGAR